MSSEAVSDLNHGPPKRRGGSGLPDSWPGGGGGGGEPVQDAFEHGQPDSQPPVAAAASIKVANIAAASSFFMA